MKPLRVLVTGSRTWDDEPLIEGALRNFEGYDDGFDDVVVVHGACPDGADEIADRVALRLGCVVERHPADWQRHGRKAGFLRNKAMVDLGADACVAFIAPCVSARCRRPKPHGSHGASTTADLAEAAGIPTVRVDYADVKAKAGQQ